MDNQHRKIKTYRELNEVEIDSMNKIKAKGEELLELYKELEDYIENQTLTAGLNLTANPFDDEAINECNRLTDAEPTKWLELGKTNIQLGISCLVRAIAQPTGC